MTRLSWLLLAVIAAGCARVEFNGDGGRGGGSPPIAGAGGAPGGSGGEGSGGEPQGGTPDPCPAVPETCNGIDDDCDGVADEPDTFPATACDCDWISFEGRPYASCDSFGVEPENVNCPAGMRIVVLQSMAEHDALLDLALTPSVESYVGARQTAGSPERDSSWQWFREGMPLPWVASEPNDFGLNNPIPFENDAENCAGFYNYGDPSDTRGLVDARCGKPFERVLCEPIADECVQGSACLLGEGCTGTFACSLAIGSQCVAVPTNEVCDGKDNDCDGEIDEAACSCAEATDPSTMRAYKLCSPLVTAVNARCGPGFRLAILDSASEIAFAEGLLAAGEAVWLGLYQRTNATALDEGWKFWDETDLALPFWFAPQPNDSDDIENSQQNCATLAPNGGHDTNCTEPHSWLCEEL